MVLAGPDWAGQGAGTPLRSDREKDLALRTVVAGGLGATEAALALARAGIDVQVYEQAQQLTEASADVSLAPNGLRMLKRLGVDEGIGRVAARHGPAQLLLSGGLPAEYRQVQAWRTAPISAISERPHVQLGVSAFRWPPCLVVRGRRCVAGLGA